MKNSVPQRKNVRGIARGFFGWLIIGNVVFSLVFWAFSFLSQNGVALAFGRDTWFQIISVVIWLSTIIASIRLYSKNRIWIFTGVLAAFALNGIVWIVMFFNLVGYSPSFGQLVTLIGFPLPGGIFLIVQ